MEELKKYWEEIFYSLGGTILFLIGAYLSATAFDKFAVLTNLLLAFCCFFTTISIVTIAAIEKIKNKK
jgi:hypothetical protein